MSQSAAVSIVPKRDWKQTSRYFLREVCGSQCNPADSYVGARLRRVVGRGAGAGEHVPLETRCRRGEWARINGAAAVKPQVKNIFGF